MPVMMDRSMKTVRGPRPPPPRNYKKSFRSQTLPIRVHSNNDRDFWQNDFDSRLNALGISNAPYKYEIRRGKTVPLFTSGQISPPADSDDSDPISGPVRPPPPRDPRRPPVRPDRPQTSSRRAETTSATARSRRQARVMYGRPTRAVEISPPSSPEIEASRYGTYPDDVSPIDEDPDMSQRELLGATRGTPTPPPRPSHGHPQPLRSHIPTRRDKQEYQDIANNALRQSRSRDNLHAANLSVKQPWEHTSHQNYTLQSDQSFGLTTTVTGPKARRTSNVPASLGQRVRQFTRGKPEPLDSRPPWNGASGRSATIDPVRDDLTVEPLRLPRKSSKRIGRTAANGSAATAGYETSSGAAATVRRLLPSRSNQKLKEVFRSSSHSDLNAQAAAAQPYPSPPQIESPISQPYAAAQPAQAPYHPGRLSPNMIPDAGKAIRRKPPPSPQTNNYTHNPHFSTSSSIYSTQPEHHNSQSQQSQPRLAPTPPSTSPFTEQDPWVQPPSRFSVTTCNTVVPDSPHLVEEDQPPLPAPTPQLASVMDRRRPVPGGDSYRSASAEPIVISMNTSYMASNEKLDQGTPLLDESGKERPVSIMSTDKALPLAPPEMLSANDRVANLEARLENLTHRRINIMKSIKKMTELMPTDNLMASSDVLRKREVEKKKVEGLKEELAEVQREEHDVGLKLHRAYKRLDKNGECEPTTLWVRRVTH